MIPNKTPMCASSVMRIEGHREMQIALGHMKAALTYTDWLAVSGALKGDEEFSDAVRAKVEEFEEWLTQESPFA